MDAHGTVTAEEGDRYPLEPPQIMSNEQSTQLAKNYLNNLSKRDRLYLLKLLVNETNTVFEHRVWLIEVPRDIRNKLNLWALCSKEQHPDDMSAVIAEEVKKELLK